MILIAIFLSLSIASAVNYLQTRKKRKLITNINGPLTLPLIGSVHKFVTLTPTNFFEKSQQYLRKYGNLSRFWAFDRLFIFIADEEFATQLLQHPDYLNTGYNLLQPLYGASVLGSDGEQWQRRHQMIAHAFRPHMLMDFVEVFVTKTKVLIECLRPQSDGKTSFDIYTYVANAMLDVMLTTALGIEGHAQHETRAEYAMAVMAAVELFTKQFLSLHSANPTIYTVLCPLLKRKQKRLLDSMNRFNKELIAAQRAALKPPQDKTMDMINSAIYTIEINDSHLTHETAKKHDTLLTVLLASNVEGASLSDAEICAELNTFIFHGTLLSSTTLSFALVMIARHPSVQQKLLEEMENVWPKGAARQYTVEQLHKLNYMECVIKETMRLYPAQPILARDLKQNFPYTHSKIGNGELPAGAELYINVYEMLRQADKFEEPSMFCAERHQSAMAEESKSVLAFSMGPRSCLAQKYVMLLMKTSIAELLRQYEVLPFGEELKLEIKIALKSTNGLQIGLKPR